MKRNARIFWLILGIFLSMCFSDEGLAQLTSSGCDGAGGSSKAGSPRAEMAISNHLMSIYPMPDACVTPQAYNLFHVGDKVMNWHYVGWCNQGDVFEWHWFSSSRNYDPVYYTIPYDDYWCVSSQWESGIPNDAGKWGVQLLYNGAYQEPDVFTVLPLPVSNAKLSVVVSPSGAGKVVGPGIDCGNGGNDCTESYVSGETVTLNAVPNAKWQLKYFVVGDVCYTSNSVSAVMDKDQTVVANFWPASDKYSLAPVDTTPLGDRLPVIFVHGSDVENNPYPYRWEKYIKALSSKALKKKFKLYIFRWDSQESSPMGGQVLGVFLDAYPELNGKQVVFIAHSRGGLVVRYYMNYYTITEAAYAGRLGGEKVKDFFPLATPHHGSPGADPMWTDFSFNYNYNKTLALALSWYYFDYLWNASDVFLQWDRLDNGPTRDTICWNSALNGDGFCSALALNGSGLDELNKSEIYFSKMTVFGANRVNPKANVQTVLANTDPSIEHGGLYLASLLMAAMPVPPDGYPTVPIDNSFRPFQANDGLVPLVSALCLKPESGRIFSFNKKGKLVFDSQALGSRLMAKRAYVFSGLKDHADFLTDATIISTVVKELMAM